MIEIVNGTTHEFKLFEDGQAIADFLAGREDAAVWTGWEFMGKLPAPTAAKEAEPEPVAAPEAAEAETLLERIEHAVEEIIHADAPGTSAD